MSAGRRSGLRALVQNGVLACASIALVLASAEIALRLLGPAAPGGKEDRVVAQYMAKDPVLGWRKRPNATAVYRRAEYSVEVRVNGLGLRDPERSREAKPGTLRMLALGDSFVEGYTVALENTVTQQLEGRLTETSACPVEVLNGGTAGWSTDQEYLYYREEAASFAARVVLLFLYYNDILENVRPSYWGRAKPVLEDRDGRLEIAPRPAGKSAGSQRRADRSAAVADPPSRTSARPHGWALHEFVRQRLLRGQPRLYQRLASLGVWPPLEPEAPSQEMRAFLAKPEPRLEAAWQHTLRILEALAADVTATGARLVVIYVPAAFEIDDRAWELTRLAYGMTEPQWRRDAVAARLVNAGRRRQLAVIDLSNALREEQRLGATYFRRDAHWSVRGHAGAAKAVAAFLRESGYLACPSPE